MLTLYKIIIGVRLNCLEYLLYEKYLVVFGYLDRESLHLGSYVTLELSSRVFVCMTNAGSGCSYLR